MQDAPVESLIFFKVKTQQIVGTPWKLTTIPWKLMLGSDESSFLSGPFSGYKFLQAFRGSKYTARPMDPSWVFLTPTWEFFFLLPKSIRSHDVSLEGLQPLTYPPENYRMTIAGWHGPPFEWVKMYLLHFLVENDGIFQQSSS